MKTYYYLEVAESVTKNGQIIPVKKLKWCVPIYFKTLYKDKEECERSRLYLYECADTYVIRVRKLNWFKSIFHRVMILLGWDYAKNFA